MTIAPPFEQDPTLAAMPGIVHGFFGRRSGRGKESCDFDMSETLGTPIAAVRANRSRALINLGLGNAGLALVTQVHSARVVVTNAPFARDHRPEEDRVSKTTAKYSHGARPEADAIITTKPGLALGILTADCAPVLFADAEAGVVAACHAGRRGAAKGIIGNTVATMLELGATIPNIRAAIGPTICGSVYELSQETIDEMAVFNPAVSDFAYVPDGKTGIHFDLPGFVISEITKLSIPAPPHPKCTYDDPDAYFSHRRFTHTGEPTGRQISMIALMPAAAEE